MPAQKLINDFAHALDVFLDLDEDRDVGPWDLKAPLDLSAPASGLWDDLPCADNPPNAFLLTIRERDGDTVYALVWAAADTEPEAWPVVEVTDAGDAQVLAANLQDWIYTLLLTGGMLGGGSEDDLEAALDDASSDGRALAEDLANELDADLPTFEQMGERFEEAQETWGDAWMDAVEGIDE